MFFAYFFFKCYNLLKDMRKVNTMNGLNYIVQAVLGGASGYITNDYAINMLFKEYTPLKLGGVIKKTRNEFIDNLSSMVENDIINKEKLHEILNSDEFKIKFEKLTDDFYKNCLYDTVGSGKFSDINGFDSTLNMTDKYVGQMLDEHMGGLISLITRNFNLSNFITEIQANTIGDSVYSSIKDILENTDAIESPLLYLFESNKEITLFEIFDENINPAIENSVNALVKITGDNAADSQIITKVFNNAADEVLNIFYDRKVKDVVKIDVEKAVNSFISSITAGQPNIAYKICQSLFSYCKTLDKSIYSFLDPDFENNLRIYIKDTLPFAVEKAAGYVQKNSITIDRLIEDSIDEVIEESEGLKARLLSTVKNTLFNNLGKKFSIADKIISFIKKAAEPDKLSTDISKKIVEQLNNITVSHIITRAESSGFSAHNAYDAVIAFIGRNNAAIIKNTESYISDMRIRDIFPMLDFSAEKILSSPAIHSFFKNKSTNRIESLLSMKLCDLISENTAEMFADKAAGYLKSKYNENEGAVKGLIFKTAKEFKIDDAAFKNEELVNFIKNETYDKYREEAHKLNDLKLSSAVDKINSIENISENSSETLRKYMIGNTDAILKGSIKGIVADNLNKLSDDDLVKFANDFIGRELKPIMFFGGVLGVIAGLILALFQNSPLNPGEINIATMLTYAFVGFITNVVAINMIFKPYREIKILSKIPFLRNFSLGYIIKNQKNFAESTANYIDSSLLSKKSINELFERHKSSIKTSFVKNIADNDYSTLSSLLMKNKDAAISGTYGFLKNKALKNLKNFSSYLYGKVSGIKLSSILTDRNIDGIYNFACENLREKDLSSSIHSFISSDKKLNTLIPADFPTNILEDKAEMLYDKAAEYLRSDNFKKDILKYDDKYKAYVSGSIQEVFNLDDEKLSLISEKLNEIILSEKFRNTAGTSAVALFNRSFHRSSTFGELFDGKLKIYLDKKLPQILKNGTDKIKSSLSERKKGILAAVRAEFKNHLGLIEKGMFSLMGGDEIIDEIITKIISDKLPKLMDAKNDEITGIVIDLINERFYKAEVDALYARLDSMQISEVIGNYLNISSVKIKNEISDLTAELYNKSKNKDTCSVLKFFNLDDLNVFVNSYESEINAFTAAMHSYLISNRHEAIEEVSSVSGAAADKFMDLKLSDIFYNVSQDNMDNIIKNTKDILRKNNSAEKILKSFAKIYKEYNNSVCLNYYINRDDFVNSTEKFINNLLTDKEAEKAAMEILYSVIDDAASSNFSFVDSESKEYTVNIFVDSCIESLRGNLDEILKSVEFDKIAAEEIEKMEPEKIHRMFNSFGEKYFRKLMLYGFGGFVFGINMYVGFALTGLKILSEIFKKDC